MTTKTEITRPEGVSQFTKKPVTISAIQWTGTNLREVIAFTGKHPRWNEWFSTWEDYERRVQQDGGVFKIITPEGTMEATPGDWIIRGVKGEHYPCKPDIFSATYDAALQSQDREDAFCVWHNDPETDSTWETGCGNLFILNDGTPAENRMKFCCYCGKQIREAIDHARRIEGDGK